MRLYLVQHGEARAKAEDPKRPLTERGRDDVARVAAFAKTVGIDIDGIRHSGIRRAKETAAVIAEHLQPKGGVVAVSGLAPKDDVTRAAELLNRETRSLMLVRHQPFMDRLTGLLVTGDRERAPVQFKKGGIVCLQRNPKTWTWMICWAITPELIR